MPQTVEVMANSFVPIKAHATAVENWSQLNFHGDEQDEEGAARFNRFNVGEWKSSRSSK